MTTSDVADWTRTQKNRTLGLLVTGHGVAHWYNGMLSVLYPVLTVSLGLTYSQVGFFDSSRGVIAVGTSMVGGYSADRIGRRRIFLALSLASMGIFTFLLSFADSFSTALIWIALGGIGNSLWHPYAIPMLGSVFSRRRSLALSLHDAGANIFHGLSPIVVGFLLTIFTWQAVTRLHLWPGLLMGGLILLALPLAKVIRSARARQPSYRQALHSGILRNRQFVLATAVSVSLTMARMVLFTFLPLYLAFELGLNSARQGLYMGVLTISGALLAPAAGELADRLGVGTVLTVAIVFATLVVLTIPFAEAGLLLVVTIALLGGAIFSTRSLILVYIISVTPPEIGGSSIGTIFSLNRLFGILSPLVAGYIADTIGLSYVFIWAGFLLMLGLGLTIVLRRSIRSKSSS